VAERAAASCNTIPGAIRNFRGALGGLDRPFAAPGDVVELRVRPAICDAEAPPLSHITAHSVVTIVFAPPSGQKHVVILATSCTGITDCAGALDTMCVPVSPSSKPVGLKAVSKGGEVVLKIRFPDTDDLGLTTADHTLSGPATIAVKDRRYVPSSTPADLAACSLVSQRCADVVGETGLIACIDELYNVDGTCGTAAGDVNATFGHFTALPPPNDFQQICNDPAPPCLDSATEIRFTTDAAGNAFIPVDWTGVLVEDTAAVPVARLLNGESAMEQLEGGGTGIKIPGQSFLASFAPEGLRLPPIFSPQHDPDAADPAPDLNVFGTADARYTVLGVARRGAERHQCVGGSNNGLACNEAADCPGVVDGCRGQCLGGTMAGSACVDHDCPGGTCDFTCVGGANGGNACLTDDCPDGDCVSGICAGGANGGDACATDDCPDGTCGGTCVGGDEDGETCAHNDCPGGVCGGTCTNSAAACAGDGDCPGGECGASLFNFATRFHNDVGPVVIARDANAMCQAPPDEYCGLEGGDALPLDGIVGTPDLFLFAVSEPLANRDANDDGDTIDRVATIRDRGTGLVLPIGDGGADGLAVGRVEQPPFSYVAVAAEDDVVAFLQSEPLQSDGSANGAGDDDVNGNGALFDPVLRAYQISGSTVFPRDNAANRAVDGAPLINGRPLVVSDGLVFFRQSEAWSGHQTTERVSVSSSETEADCRQCGISANTGQACTSDADCPGACAAGVCNSGSNFGLPCVTDADCPLVCTAYCQGGVNNGQLCASDANCPGVCAGGFCGGGSNVGGSCVTDADCPNVCKNTTCQGAGNASISADGQHVAFDSDTPNLVSGDTVACGTLNCRDVFVRNRVFGTTRLISVDAGGNPGNSVSSRPSMSADGRFVAFESDASDLVPGDSNGLRDVFVYDRDPNGDGFDGADFSIARVSVTSAGLQATALPPWGFSEPSISADGRFVAFLVTDPTSLDASDTNSASDVYVRDRDPNGDGFDGPDGSTTRVSLASSGAQANLPSRGAVISGNGRYVAFESQSTTFDPTDTVTCGVAGSCYDIFVRDRDADEDGAFDEPTDTTVRVSLTSTGGNANNSCEQASISDDGRFIAFNSIATNLLPDEGGQVEHDAFVVDRDSDGDGEFTTLLLRRATVASDGTIQSNSGGGYPTTPVLSPDGRAVAFESPSTNLVEGDTTGIIDVFAHDLTTGHTHRVNVADNGTDPNGTAGDAPARYAALSRGGLHVAFESGAHNLVAADTNLVFDVFVRGVGRGPQCGNGMLDAGEECDSSAGVLCSSAPLPYCSTTCSCNDFDFDSSFDDNMLMALRGSDGSVYSLCPATQVAVHNGKAAFLRPESFVGSGADCGDPGPNLNNDGGGDADLSDTVVQFWDGPGANALNFWCAATKVVLNDTYVAALVSERGQNDTDLNTDGDTLDDVVFFRAHATQPGSCAGGWVKPQTGANAWAADDIGITGDYLVFITPECGQGGGGVFVGCPGGGSDLNFDGDASDRVLQYVNVNNPTSVFNTAQPAVDFQLGECVVAFRTREGDQGAGNDLNQDGDFADEVLQILDICLGPPAVSSKQAIAPCNSQACDPRFPYRVVEDRVRFLTVEANQGQDLNNDGAIDDIVLQTLEFPQDVELLGNVAPTGAAQVDPLRGDPLEEGSGTEVFIASGVCLENLKIPCTVPGVGQPDPCENGAVCGSVPGSSPTTYACLKSHGACERDSQCPPNVTCEPDLVVLASADSDGDQVPDAEDNCPNDPNADQTDLDTDGVGDLCDLQTCGNGELEGDEVCDGALAGACGGNSCNDDCTCPCTNVVGDPLAKVVVRTRNDAGRLRVRFDVPFAGYAGEPVRVRLDDISGAPLAAETIASDGVGPLAPRPSGLKWVFKRRDLGVKRIVLRDLETGMFRIIVRAKKWFSAADVPADVADIRFTIHIGNTCFTRTATIKIQ
jgi:Tol biopolymer transport system component